MLASFLSHLDPQEKALFQSLDSPARIQAFLDEIQYPATDRNRCPLNVLRDRQGHCLDGALFAAAALRQLGHTPLIVDMYPEPGLDDDHVLAIYKLNGRYGALAKSNFVPLRYREPVYHSLRELVMSYFDGFFNVDGLRTMRSYTRPLKLAAYDQTGWMWRDAGADAIEQRLLQLYRYPILTPEMAANLVKVDPRSYQAGTLGVNPAGLYQPKK